MVEKPGKGVKRKIQDTVEPPSLKPKIRGKPLLDIPSRRVLGWDNFVR